VAAVEAPHWWDEVHPLSVYLERFKRALPAIEAAPARVVSGDVSFATFSFTWTGSQRVNVEWAASMKECREECARTSTGDDERRACIDGGCYTRAANAYKGLRLSVPQLMRSVYRSFPLRMVVVLRDPVERLHTAFWNYEHYAKKYGATEEGFSTYALEMVGHAQLCLAKHSEFDCLTGFESLEPRFEEVFYHADQLWKGVYSTFFEGWEASFPGAVLPIRLEDYAAPGGVRETLQRVIPHLRLTPLDEPALAALLEGDVRTQGEPTLRARRGVMDEKTRLALREFYAPFNAKLATLLGDDKWRWGY
jgi:N-acetylgalactosamine 4-sulfate 6-O-sulfotransferase